MRWLLDAITRDWLNKVLALGLAIIIFWLVDEKITENFEGDFIIRFSQQVEQDQDARGRTIFVALRPEYTATLEPIGDAGIDSNVISVKFTGPKELVNELKGRSTLIGRLNINRSFSDDKTVEDVWNIPGSQVQFPQVDQAKVQVDVPDLRIRLLRLETRHVEVVADLDWFTVRPGYRKGEAQPDRPTVRVTCPRKYADFHTVHLRPVGEGGEGSEDDRMLSDVDAANVRLFTVERPRNVPPNVMFESDPSNMKVSIPLVPVNEKRDIEVPIVLRVPTDGSLGAGIPKASKIRETFTFIGPPDLLKRMKELEGTGEEIQAVIDLTGLSNDRIAELKKDGIPAKPAFVYPIAGARDQVRCEQPKDIWISLAK